MTEGKPGAARFSFFFSWGGIVIVLLGLFLMATGDLNRGLMFAASGVIFWLFAKRRKRQSE